MNRFRTLPLLLGASAACVAFGARAGDYVVVGAVNRIADRCAAQYGAGFVDNGNGFCSRVSNHVRVYVLPGDGSMSAWSSGPARNAAVTNTDSTSMVPVMPTQRLRVRGNLDSYSPFR